MPDFKKTNKFSKPGSFNRGGTGRPSFAGAGPRHGGSRDFSASTELFKATCNKCNKSCDVPFRPNGKKPVYCKDCFVRDDARPTGNSYEKPRYSNDRPQAQSYAPAPVAVEDPRIGYLQKELAIVHSKLDTLIERLEGAAFSSIIASSNERAEKPAKAVKKEVVAKPVKKVAKKKSA